MVFYGVGFGPAMSLASQSLIPAGQVVTQANQLVAPLTVLFGTTPATVVYAGLAPSYVGLYHFNVIVPAIAGSDTVPVTFLLSGAPGQQTLYTAVHQ